MRWLSDLAARLQQRAEPSAALSSPSSKLPSRKVRGGLGAYRLGPRVGEGGSGRVYQAESDAGEVAIKVLKVEEAADADELKRRMEREIRILQQLQHPGIVRFLDWGDSEAGPFLVMELVHGTSLREHVPMPADDVHVLLRHLAEAIAYAHEQGVVHRDLKPENILLVENGVKITDFGLARSEFMTLISRQGALGSPDYMAPELFTGEWATAACDQYSLGIVAYELLVGQRPFQGSLMQLMGAHQLQAPPPLPEAVPAPLRAVIMRMLEKTAAARWPDLRAVVLALG